MNTEHIPIRNQAYKWNTGMHPDFQSFRNKEYMEIGHSRVSIMALGYKKSGHPQWIARWGHV